MSSSLTPAGTMKLFRSFLHRYQPSPTRGRVGTCIVVFEAINVHSHYNLHARRIAYTILYTEGSNDLVT
jgi:hypothetical protein